ncbi:hypothetical protein E4U61_005652 [Claviceps capensis]|nr:hypothetical protein E4U61_005652 [Claviceps capensis]
MEDHAPDRASDTNSQLAQPPAPVENPPAPAPQKHSQEGNAGKAVNMHDTSAAAIERPWESDVNQTYQRRHANVPKPKSKSYLTNCDISL